MKRLALSLFVIATSGAYAWTQSGRMTSGDVLALPSPLADAATPVSSSPVAATMVTVTDVGPRSLPSVEQPPAVEPSVTSAAVETDTEVADESPPAASIDTSASPVLAEAPAPALAATAPADVPLPHLRPEKPTLTRRAIPVAMTVPSRPAGYADGAYIGPVTDAYYGEIQIQALVQQGKLVAIKVLRFPSDRRTSVAINRQALPMLRDEVIAAQSANVDVVSGATLTSEAFIQSIGGALRQARS